VFVLDYLKGYARADLGDGCINLSPQKYEDTAMVCTHYESTIVLVSRFQKHVARFLPLPMVCVCDC